MPGGSRGRTSPRANAKIPWPRNCGASHLPHEGSGIPSRAGNIPPLAMNSVQIGHNGT
jgi:hypothetical protein